MPARSQQLHGHVVRVHATLTRYVLPSNVQGLSDTRVSSGTRACVLMLRRCLCRALLELLHNIPEQVKQQTRRLAFDGTSPTAILLDRHTGVVLEPVKLNSEAQPAESVAAAKARPQHPALLSSTCNSHTAQKCQPLRLISMSDAARRAPLRRLPGTMADSRQIQRSWMPGVQRPDATPTPTARKQCTRACSHACMCHGDG